MYNILLLYIDIYNIICTT